MSRTLNDSTTALAGILQAVSLVDQIARNGLADQSALETSINSLFISDPENTIDVYGDARQLHAGMRTIIEQFSSPDKRNIEIMRYTIAVIVLERKLNKLPGILEKISTGIEKSRAQAEHFTRTHENIIASLAQLYTDTISKLTPRIIVHGEHGHLSNPNNANKVRALLLAAIRSAVLWRQCGGNRWQLLLKRKAITDAANKLIV